MKNNNTEQEEFVGFHFMGDVIDHAVSLKMRAKQAHDLALKHGFSLKQADIIQTEVERKIQQDIDWHLSKIAEMCRQLAKLNYGR